MGQRHYTIFLQKLQCPGVYPAKFTKTHRLFSFSFWKKRFSLPSFPAGLGGKREAACAKAKGSLDAFPPYTSMMIGKIIGLRRVRSYKSRDRESLIFVLSVPQSWMPFSAHCSKTE